MRIVLFVLISLVAVSNVCAQQTQQQSTALDRISQSYGICIGTLENARDEMQKMQKENLALKVELDKLKKERPDAK
jgi:regulator of replication initiation timing